MKDQRILAEIEHDLAEHDPRLAGLLGSFGASKINVHRVLSALRRWIGLGP